MNSFLSRANALGLVLDHRAGWVSLVNARSSLIYSSDQKCHSIRARHWLLLGGRITLSEVESEVRNGLSESLDSNGLQISVSVVEGFDSTVLN